MKIKNIFGEEIKYRPCIGAVLDALYNDFSLSPSKSMKDSKLMSWHMALEGISDKAIATGYSQCIVEKLKFIPSSGVFRAMCIQPPEPKTEKQIPYKPTKQDLEAKNRFFTKLRGLV